MKIKDLPDSSKPRERFLKQGPEALSDAELFAILLRTGTRGKKGQAGENVIEMSNRLIKEYGIDKLFDCSLKELQEINGIGPSKAMQILVMNEILKRIHLSEKPITKITCGEDVFKLFQDRLKDKKEEHFYVLMLNNQNNIIAEQEVSKGILDASIIHPREVFKPAIKNSASKIILVHNHPSGDPAPSVEDLEAIENLSEAGQGLGIKILDFIIIGRETFWSQRERN